jgi:glutathione-regulated potassium-efflux system ancillary protein KefC
MHEVYPHYKDRAKLIAAQKEGRQQFQEQIAREREERRQRTHVDWEQVEQQERTS